jgi:hypothetical protein
MRRSLQIISVLMAVLLAVRMMGQDTGGAGAAGGGSDSSSGAGSSAGTTSPDNSGASGAGVPGMGEGTTNGGDTIMPQGGADQGQGGTGTGGLMGPGTEIPATGTPGGEVLQPPEPGAATEGPAGGSLLAPLPGTEGPPPGSIAPVPGTTPAPTPAGPGSVTAGTQGAVQTPPVTFTLPGGYGGSPAQTFTLGQGRFSKPPITFTLSVSQGYDDNLFDATSHPVATPTPTPGPTPTIERRIVDFFIGPPAFLPILQNFQAKAGATPTPPPTLGKVGSAVSTVTVGAQVQAGSARTVLTSDGSIGALDYWSRPGGKVDYNGNFDLSLVHRITPRATLSVAATLTYAKTPNFALINAPTNNGSGGAYLNWDLKANLSYTWSSRISTVTSYDLGLNLENSSPTNNLYTETYGNQFRYTASSRNTLTAEIRDAETIYPTNSAANSGSLFYLLGIDSVLSSRLRNTFSVGIQTVSYSSGGASNQTLPYFESATTLSLPRGAGLTWTNRVGAENTGVAAQTANSYRTGLTYSQPLSTKLVASVSLAYNYFKDTDDSDSAASYTQNQLETSLSLGYNISPRFSLSLSYTYTNLSTTQVNTAYERQQIYLGGSYTFR